MRKKYLLIILGVVVLIVASVGAFFILNPASNSSGEKLIQVTTPEETVYCPMETKICPDGNIVIQNNEDGCAFYECPVDVTLTNPTE